MASNNSYVIGDIIPLVSNFVDKDNSVINVNNAVAQIFFQNSVINMISLSEILPGIYTAEWNTNGLSEGEYQILFSGYYSLESTTIQYLETYNLVSQPQICFGN
jgi:hypothetical protein